MRNRKRRFEPFLINPHKRRLRLTRKATNRKRKRNSMAMVVGNPRRKGGVIRMAKRRRKRVSFRKRNPRRLRGIFRAAKRKKRNPTYIRKRWSRRRRNPIVGGAKMEKLTTVLIGALSAIAVTAVPNFIKANTTLMKLGSQAATVLLGGFLVGKMLRSTEKGFVWSLVGGSVIVADLLKTYVLKGLLPSAGLEGLRGRLGQHYYLPAPAAGSPGYYIPEQDYSVVPLGPF